MIYIIDELKGRDGIKPFKKGEWIGRTSIMDRSEINNQQRIKNWKEKELHIVWKMDLDFQRETLTLCDFD